MSYRKPPAQGKAPAPDLPPRPLLPEIRATHRTELVVDGVVQSVDVERGDVPDYWHAMLPAAAPARGLLLGAGGGTLAALLLRRFPATRIVALDHNPAIVALGRRALYLDHPAIDLVIADAFQFCAACTGRFDYIAVDLFDGGRWPARAAARPFLLDLRRLCARGGSVVFNLFQDSRLPSRIERIERVLGVPAACTVGRNRLLHFRPRA